jgi:hypothetical protein
MAKGFMFISSDMWDDFERLVRLTAEKLESLAKLFDSDYCLKPRLERSMILATELGVSGELGFSLNQLCQFLSSEREKYGLQADEFFKQLSDTLPVEKEELRALILQKRLHLWKLFGPKPGEEYWKKRSDLGKGLVKTLSSIRAFCDVRPVFDLQRSTVREYLLVTILGIDVEDEKGNEDRYVFQLDSDGLLKLKEAISLIDKKLEVIKRDLKIATQT